MLPHLCCAIHPCHFTLSALDPVCCCILTASLFSALFFAHDCHSMHTCYSMDTFPIPHAPPCSRPQSRCLIHIISCRFMLVASFSCLLFNSHMPIAQFMLLTLLMSVIPPILFTCFMLLTHFSIIFLVLFYACHFILHR